ncbi:MAG: hypothetical protein ACFFCW_19900 [Candidatus Hodarchaeota archaeon]
MNIGNIHRMLHDRYADVKEFRPSVFRACYTHNQRIVGIYFFDCSKELFDPGFDLDVYQDQLLSEDYYAHPGAAQWNFYLYFVCDKKRYDSLIKSSRASEIGSNKEYARKYLITEELLEREFSLLSTLSRKPTEAPAEDISVRWIEKLKKHGLDGAFMADVPRAQVVDRYIQGDPILEDLGREADQTSAEELIPSSIRCLNLKPKRYRPYPQQRDFEFGLSNLVEGINGSGKTSLLEAIELWMCGRTLRDYKNKHTEDFGTVGIQFAGSKGFEWNERVANDVYRERDLLWYGNHYAKGNRLCYGFNRFNFYNSDAAAKLANEDDQKAVNDALSSLILGETANIIEKRLQALLPLFKQHQISYEKELAAFKREIHQAKEELSVLKPPGEKKRDIFLRFLDELKRIGWRGAIPKDEDSTIRDLLQDLGRASSCVKECQSQLSWLPSFSLSSIRAEEKTLAKLIQEVEKTNQDIRNAESEVKNLTEKAELESSEIKKINALKRYVFDKESSKLTGMGDAISRNQEEKKRFSHAEAITKDIDLKKYASVEDSISKLESKYGALLIKLHEEVDACKKRIKELENKRGRIARLGEEIRSKGLELLSEDPNVKSCPLCGAKYKTGELAARIGEQREDSEGADLLADSITNLSKAKTELDEVETAAEELRRIKNAALILLDAADVSKLGLAEAVKRISALPHLLARLSGDLDELLALKDRLENKGLLEEEYRSLAQWFREKYRAVPLDYPSRDEFERFRTDKEQAFNKLSTTILSGAREVLSELIGKKESRIQGYFSSHPAREEGELELKGRFDQIKNAVKLYEETSEKISVSPKETIAEINVRLRELEALYDQFQRSRKYFEESARIREMNEEKIKNARSQLAVVQEKKDRADIAINTITEILEHDTKEKHLHAFLQSNMTDIADTFRLIHAPREFSNIELDDEDAGVLLLIREESGIKSPITQISSGQRASLALSIFMTLNRRLTKAPPLMIFDDPVAHVDDLNILSFLDYLKEVAIVGQRQLFFATASQKVATLYKKKFDFLGTEFKSIKLERELTALLT